MSVSINNPNAIFDPIVAEQAATTEAIEAQTEFMEAQVACQTAAIQAIYNQPLSCAGGTSEMIATLQASDPPCCRTEELTQAEINEMYPEATSVSREICDNGQVTDTITYPDSEEPCVKTISSANPVSSLLDYDENCEPFLTDVLCECKPQEPGAPYNEYFIPLVSDFGNQIYCVPDSTYAFAWSGVTNVNIKEFLEQNADAIDLEDPTNKYVAVIDGGPYQCGGFDPDAGASVPFGDPAGLDENGDEFLHPLQLSQALRLGGCYSPVQKICPAWSGTPESSGDDAGDGLGLGDVDLSGIDCSAPEIDGKNAASAYAALWRDWWECEKRDKKIRNVILGVQGFGAAAALVESIRLYNRILDKNLDILCDVRDNVILQRNCAEEYLNGENGLIKVCQRNLLQDHMERIGTINNRGQAFCEFADDEFDCYTKLWKPVQTAYANPLADKLFGMIRDGEFSSSQAAAWADALEECVDANMMPELKRQFAPLLASVNCVSNNLNDWRGDLKQKARDLYSHFDTVYKSGEGEMIPPIMDMTACMVQRVCELRDLLVECGKCDLSVYQKGYQNHEIPQANAAMSTAAEVVPRLIESVRWLDTNIPAALDIFKTCYADEQRTLNPLLFANSRNLAPEIQNCFDYFSSKGRADRQFFEMCYQDRECRLVKAQLDLACKLTQRLEDNLCRLESWATNDRAFYDENFRHVEQLATPDIVWNGNEASNDLDDFRGWWLDRSNQFLDIIDRDWFPCDRENLKQHCDVWNYTNPLREVHSNADQAKLMSLDADDAYRKSIIEATSLLQEVFHGPDESFDYCIEDPAVLHVRKRVEQELEDFKKNTPQHCKGWLMEGTARLKAGLVEAEGSAYAAANRWKWVANQQLDRKQFEQKTSLLQVFDGFAVRSLDANRLSTANHELLLRSMSEAIIRGDKFYGGMQDSGRNAITIMGNELDTMIRMIQLWHFWPEMALSNQQSFIQSSQGTIDDAQNLIQLGHFWPDMAMRQKQSAAQISENAVDLGVRMSQIGHFYLQQATTMNAQRASNAVSGGQLGNDFARTGHNLHQLGSNKIQNALNSSLQAGQVGIAAGDLGAKHAATALEIENLMVLNGLEHLKAGIGAMGVGIDFLQEVRQSYTASGNYGNNAANTLVNLFKHGQNNGLLALGANEQCRDTEFQMLSLAKEFLLNNYRINQNSINGSASTLNAANNLLQQQANNAGGAFGLLGNAVEGIVGSNTSAPPFPTGGFGFPGQGAFGFSGGAFT